MSMVCPISFPDNLDEAIGELLGDWQKEKETNVYHISV
jgi:hypothetical protein